MKHTPYPRVGARIEELPLIPSAPLAYNEPMTRHDIVARLRNEQGERSLREFARDLGVSPAYLSDIYQGRRDPGPAILVYLGLRKVLRVEYVPAK